MTKHTLRQDVQRTYGEEGFTGTESQALGGGDAHTEACVRTRTGADAYGVAILDTHALGIQDLLYQRGGERCLLPGLSTNTFFYNSPVHGYTHGQDCSRSIYQKDASHYSFLRR
jgi:hypothetical protein